MKKQLKYAVVMLNYNTFNDAIIAAKSIIKNSLIDNFLIFIGDNSINNSYDLIIKENMQQTKVIKLSNRGYAVGNNEIIKKINEEYNPSYLVIMNPDVEIVTKGTIENLIIEIEANPLYIGAQPLVWNIYSKIKPNFQMNIRKLPDKFDYLLLNSLVLRYIFFNRYKFLTYLDKTPYTTKKIEYFVPSGAFFIIKNTTFHSIGLFDENTFLYNEEYIIGEKIRKIRKKFIFIPSIMVKHKHGVSIKQNREQFSFFARSKYKESSLYYAKNYISYSILYLKFLSVLINIDTAIRWIVTRL